MGSISLGPIALPIAPLVLLAALWVASWTATRLSIRWAGDPASASATDAAGRTVFGAAGIGLATARAVHLGLNAAPYLASPTSMLDLRTLFYDAQGSLVDVHFGVLNPAAVESRLQSLRGSR